MRINFTRFGSLGLVAAIALAVSASTGTVQGAFIIEVDTDGADDGVLTFSPNFSFGGDTTAASQSSPSSAVGLTGGDSIFGGNGVDEPDTYLYTYSLGTDADNANFAAGQDLGNGNNASGLTGGQSGTYNVYATWPFTTNVSGGLTTYTLTDSGGSAILTTQVDQNNDGDDWILLGSADLTAGMTYTLSQTAGENTFVSMRSAAVMFEATRVVPEPASLALMGLGVAGFPALVRFRARRRREATRA